MSSETVRPGIRSAAWRISLWATLAFACGTMLVFVHLDRFVASDIQRRNDAWLVGEAETLGDVAERTPNDSVYDLVVSEVAELATHEVPNKLPNEPVSNESVFFLQTGKDGSLKLWVGQGDGRANLQAIRRAGIVEEDHPQDIRVDGSPVPFRVAMNIIQDGSQIFLGLSERDQLRVLGNLRLRFFLLWLAVVMLGFAIVFLTTRRMLSHVQRISEAASRIGHAELNRRVPTSDRNDEIAHLALTLNRMLDRIESSVHQLHTITDSLAHDLRSPLTAIRGKMEASLSTIHDGDQAEAIVSAIEELDRLADFLNKSLDVAEAKADALRLSPSEFDLHELLQAMVELYEPSMSERGLQIRLQSGGSLKMAGDSALLHRMIANLFDNELKHLQPGRSVTVRLKKAENAATLVFEDNGAGFDAEILSDLFVRRVKGKGSSGHGLGLAFADAVVRAHGGSITACNAEGGGARIVISLPLTRVAGGRSLAAAGSM